MKNLPAVGRTVKITSAPRTDCIGRVERITDAGFAVVRVPNWCADGWHMDFPARATDLEYSTVAKMDAAAAKR